MLQVIGHISLSGVPGVLIVFSCKDDPPDDCTDEVMPIDNMLEMSASNCPGMEIRTYEKEGKEDGVSRQRRFSVFLSSLDLTSSDEHSQIHSVRYPCPSGNKCCSGREPACLLWFVKF